MRAMPEIFIVWPLQAVVIAGPMSAHLTVMEISPFAGCIVIASVVSSILATHFGA